MANTLELEFNGKMYPVAFTLLGLKQWAIHRGCPENPFSIFQQARADLDFQVEVIYFGLWGGAKLEGKKLNVTMDDIYNHGSFEEITEFMAAWADSRLMKMSKKGAKVKRKKKARGRR